MGYAVTFGELGDSFGERKFTDLDKAVARKLPREGPNCKMGKRERSERKIF